MDIYPKQCNHRVSFGSTTRYCGNYARKGKDFCWMHDGTPKKSERLQAANATLKEAILSVPISEYAEAQRDGCDANGAWDCFIQALHEWKDHALKGESNG